MAKSPLAQNLQDWIAARERFHLSHAHIRMAPELGMNPKKLSELDSHHQEPWKAPLAGFIERLYSRRFGRKRPEAVLAVEERMRAAEVRKAARTEARRRAHACSPRGA